MKLIFVFISVIMFSSCKAQQAAVVPGTTIIPSAYRTAVYLPLLQGKRVGIFANHTSLIGNTHLVDSLQKLGIHIVKIFAPEHGFRGNADAGAKIDNDTDKQTGIPVISLYGKKIKPTPDDVNNIDVLVFDIQDVGVRFYTYIASLQYFMEAAFENSKPLLILDRPNPNGFYIDGPVLDTNYKSFIGMQPVPVVYGMTIGEYAWMIAEEKWTTPRFPVILDIDGKDMKIDHTVLSREPDLKTKYLHLTIIKCENYTHDSRYILPVNPSPNLHDMNAIYWYPSTCFFEGTTCSEGRGTEHPFAVFGHPLLPQTLYAFTPHSNEGAAEPKWKDKQCYGWNITNEKATPQLQLKWLLQAYRLFSGKDSFFIKPKSGKPTDCFFNKLAGNNVLMQQLIDGKSEAGIRQSWQPQLAAFKQTRKKYLLYKDF